MQKSTRLVRKEEPEKKPDKPRVVLDTNVLISAFLSPLGIPGQIVSMVLQGQLQFCYTQEIIAEYKYVSSRPGLNFSSLAEERSFVLETLQEEGLMYNISALSIFLIQDESDRIFYDTAKAAEAFLVTGNRKHFPDEPFIFTPHEFIGTYYAIY